MIEPSPRVEPKEEIATFIRSGKFLHVNSNRIRHEALMPRLVDRRWETSISRTEGISHEDVWGLARLHFERPPELVAKAIGYSKATYVYDQKLEFEADGIPYSRHANIIGWTNISPAKHAEKLQAQKLAVHSTYQTRESLRK